MVSHGFALQTEFNRFVCISKWLLKSYLRGLLAQEQYHCSCQHPSRLLQQHRRFGQLRAEEKLSQR